LALEEAAEKKRTAEALALKEVMEKKKADAAAEKKRAEAALALKEEAVKKKIQDEISVKEAKAEKLAANLSAI